MRSETQTVLLVGSAICNALLLALVIAFTARYNMIERVKIKAGLQKPAVVRRNEPQYANMKSVYESMPRIDSSIVFVGDSLTASCPWAEFLQNPRVRNRGIGADTASGILERLDEILTPPPRKIFFEIGLSDLGRFFPPAESLLTYGRIIDIVRARAPDVEVFIQSMLPIDMAMAPPSRAEIVGFNQQLRSLAARKNCTFIDLYPLFVGPKGDLDAIYSEDGVHLNGPGYVRWRAAIQRYVE